MYSASAPTAHILREDNETQKNRKKDRVKLKKEKLQNEDPRLNVLSDARRQEIRINALSDVKRHEIDKVSQETINRPTFLNEFRQHANLFELRQSVQKVAPKDYLTITMRFLLLVCS